MAEPDEQPPMLNYAAPDPASGGRVVGQAIGSAVLTCVATCGAVAGLMLFGMAMENGIFSLIGAVVYLVLIGFISARTYRNPAHRGIGIGIWIGFGIATLIEGTCFFLNR